MNKSYRFFAVSFVALCACAPVVAAQNAPTFMSKYGEIQSVNKYSSNPFWSPDSPYNQRFPTPIYATGPDVNTGDCNRIVQNLITEYCASRGDCANARISDVRPHIMVSLSQLPGHNFATSCGGYIDTIFESYQKTYGNSSTGIVNIVPIQNKATAPSIQIENPFKQTKSAAEIAMDARTAELENLQKKTPAPAHDTRRATRAHMPAHMPARRRRAPLGLRPRCARATACNFEPRLLPPPGCVTVVTPWQSQIVCLCAKKLQKVLVVRIFFVTLPP